MKELSRFDYMYIIIIILLVASLTWVILPYVYSVYNNGADTPDCILDSDTIQCDQNTNSCEFNCTHINGTIEKRFIRGS
jgi:hypothetical protein